MDELELVRAIRAGISDPGPERLATGRQRLLVAIAGASRAPAPSGRPRRLMPVLAAATALAAVAIVLAGGIHGTVQAPRARASLAQRVLRAAALSASSRRAVTPPAGQWIYTQTTSYSAGAGRVSTESWERFDGRGEAYYQGRQLIVDRTPGLGAAGGSPLVRFLTHPTPSSAYRALASLPRSPEELLAAVARHVRGSEIVGSGWDPAGGRLSRAQLEFGFLADLLWNAAQAAPARPEAAAFRAMAAIPGVAARRGVTDAIGRPAVALSVGGVDQQLLLDPATYRVTGQRTLSNGDWPAPASGGGTITAGRVVQSVAWGRIDFVGGPGRR